MPWYQRVCAGFLLLGKYLLPSSLTGLMIGFSSSQTTGPESLTFSLTVCQRPFSILCHMGLSIRQLTIWQLASLRASKWDSKRGWEPKTETKVLYHQILERSSHSLCHTYSLEVSHWRHPQGHRCHPQGHIRTTSLCLVLTIKTSWKWWHAQSHSYPSFTLPLSTIPIQILGPTAHWWLGLMSISQWWCPKVNRWKPRTHNTKLSLSECLSESIWYIHMTHSLGHQK